MAMEAQDDNMDIDDATIFGVPLTQPFDTPSTQPFETPSFDSKGNCENSNCNRFVEATLICGHKVCSPCSFVQTVGGPRLSCPLCPGDMIPSHEACSTDLTPNRTRHVSASGNGDISPLKQEHDRNRRTIFHTIAAYRENHCRPVPLPLEKLSYYCHVASNPVAGDIYVSDYFNNNIRHCTPHGRLRYTYGTEGNVNCRNPCGITVNANGDVAIADTGNKRVLASGLTSTGPWQTPYGQGSFHMVKGVAYGLGDYRIYCADFKNVKICNTACNTVEEVFMDRFVDSLYDVCVDRHHIYASSEDSGRVFKYNYEGVLMKVIYEGDHSSQKFTGLTLDGFGHLLVCDHINDCVKVFKTDGTYLDAFPLPGKPDSVAVQPHTMNIVVSYRLPTTPYPEGVVAFLCDPSTIN